jgi:hypothetical protein
MQPEWGKREMRIPRLFVGKPEGKMYGTWLRHYATNCKVAGSKPDEVNEFFSIYLILSAALGPGVYAASNRSEYQK